MFNRDHLTEAVQQSNTADANKNYLTPNWNAKIKDLLYKRS